MKHSGVLSILTFSLGYLTGISMLFANELHLKFAGCLLISYFTFLLVSDIEDRLEQ
jgi:hypothetical protein